MTSGTIIKATAVMIFNVKRLDDELKMVRFEATSRFEGSRFGNSPATPVKTTNTIVRHEKMNALPTIFLEANSFTGSSEKTAITGMISRTGTLIKLSYSLVAG